MTNGERQSVQKWLAPQRFRSNRSPEKQRGFLPPIHIREVKGTVKSKNLKRKTLNPAAGCIFARVRPREFVFTKWRDSGSK